ncbi:MAG TPA: DUF3108 domain-containing protein [Parasegetibacter sp.]|jgi:hypothetical protein
MKIFGVLLLILISFSGLRSADSDSDFLNNSDFITDIKQNAENQFSYDQQDSVSSILNQTTCGLKNTAFQAGESITLKVFYTLAGIYVGAGEATFTTTLKKLNNKPVYHVVAQGGTYSFYDKFFKVRDRYETYIDTAHLIPYKFIRNIDEGGYKKYENVSFNRTANTAVTTNGVTKVPECVQDVISMVYYARNLDFDKYKEGDKIPFSMFIDDEVHNLYMRYLGKETVKTKYGKFKAIKFKPLLIKGSVFEGGENMTVWVSDDANRLPLRIESAISVGSIKVDMSQYRNLRYPLSSLISVR